MQVSSTDAPRDRPDSRRPAAPLTTAARWVAAALGIAVVVLPAGWWEAGRIQADLTARAEASLDAAKITADVRYHGVDAVITDLSRAEDAGLARYLVGAVPGTRRVELVIEEAS